MALKAQRKEVAAEADVVVEDNKKGRDPDFAVLKRQPAERGSDGKLYRSENFVTVGAAWKSEKPDKKTGEMVEYIGIKPHLKFEVDEDGLLLRTYRKRTQD